MTLKKNIAISESGFVFNPGTGDSYKVNQIGIDILHLIQEGKEDSEIAESIILKYDVTKKMFEKYYLDFITTLKSENFLE